jgi:RNA polymerase sigma-70 factor (ECF subfamily)
MTEILMPDTAQSGDTDDFDTLVRRYRHELQVHCYRMLGSTLDAEDLVQETLLRAWRNRTQFEGRSSIRAWLYRIATNACLDALEHASRRLRPVGLLADPLAELAGLEPYPDRLLDGPTSADDPEAQAVSRETIELAFIAALLHLPPRQRAVLIIRDVLGWSPAETAVVLDTTTTAVNSLLQRARVAMQQAVPARAEWRRSMVSAEEQAVLDRYVAAHERGDADTIIAMLHEDIRITMPPEPACIGPAASESFFRSILGDDAPGEWRLVMIGANRQPAAANYLRRPSDDRFRALSIDVLRVVDNRLVEVNCFLGDALFPAFGLATSL